MTRLKGRRAGLYCKDTDDDGCADRVRGEEEMKACALGDVVFALFRNTSETANSSKRRLVC